MSGYRQNRFDPNAGGDFGPPVRPYNWVQWAGVGLALIGVAIDLIYLAGRLRAVPTVFDSPSIGVALPLFGVALINSRRQPGQPPRPEAQRRKAIIIAAALATCLLAAALTFYFKGAQ